MTGLIVAFGGSISIHALVKRATEYVDPLPYLTGISIHALVKRATSTKCEFSFSKISISIHALVKRATLFCGVSCLPTGNFNPRPREEGDGINVTTECFKVISIHALVKRATTAVVGWAANIVIFQSTPS